MSTNDVIESYLRRLGEALAELREPDRDDLVADVRGYLEDAVASGTDPGAAVGELGDPTALARRLHAHDADEDGARPPAPPDDAKRILGVPYNFGPMSAEEVASRLWNPSDPRILMPRVFGIGWTFNLGAIAVRLGLVRPDDEEPVPFTSVPDGALWAGLAAVTAATAVAVVAAAVFHDVPRPLPVHWGFGGPDGFATPLAAALQLLGPLAALDAVALTRALRRRSSRTERTLSVAGLALAVVMLGGLWADALHWALRGRELYSPGLTVLAGIVVMFVVIVVYSRLGVRAEWRDARPE